MYLQIKLITIVLYLVVIAIIWYIVRLQLNGSEGFDYTYELPNLSASKDQTAEAIDIIGGVEPSGLRSFGTSLINTKRGKKFAATYRTIKYKDTKPIPSSFNGLEVWKDYLTPVVQQNSCGFCWSCSTSCALADRFAILSLGQIKFIPSPYEMVICSQKFTSKDIAKQWKNIDEYKKMDGDLKKNRGCSGATLYEAVNEIFQSGIPGVSCFPDQLPKPNVTTVSNMTNNNQIPYCYTIEGLELDSCSDGTSAIRKYRCVTGYSVDSNEEAIKRDIYKYGPAVCGIVVFDDFMKWDGNGIYMGPKKDAKEVGGHAVSLLGYGTENGVDYWLIRNSWGKYNNLGGFFKMKRNIPECQLEQNVVAMIPDIPNFVIEDASLQPVETQDDIDVYKFTGHALDAETGFYQTSIDKISRCEQTGDVTKIIPDGFKLPKSSDFYAGNILDYLKKNPVKLITQTISKVSCDVIGSKSITNKVVDIDVVKTTVSSDSTESIFQNKLLYDLLFGFVGISGIPLLWFSMDKTGLKKYLD